MTGDELLRTAAVAEMTGLSPKTLTGWRARPDGPGPKGWFRLGRAVVIRRSVVEAWIAEQERAGAA